MIYKTGRDVFSKRPQLLSGLLGALASQVPQGLRYGAEFRRMRRFLRDSQWWSRERLEAYQLERLRDTVAYAQENVPYYRDAFARARVSVEDLRTLADIRRFPTIDKETVLENYDRLLSPRLEGQQLMPYCTGGTTGSGVILLFEERFRQREQAFVWRLWNEVGYSGRMFAAILQHRECPPDLNDGLWYLDRVSNAIVLSAHRLGADTVGRYLEALDSHRPRVLIAYPSLAWLLVNYARESGREQFPLDLVLCGSETLYDFQRAALESFFEAPVRIHYGHVESCALFGYCRHSNLYHVQMEYGLTEILRDDDTEAEAGEVGEVVATGFDNYAMPLIRFRTRDFAEVSKRSCACGRAFPMVERIQGRDSDFLRTPTGQVHSPTIIEVIMDRLLIEGYAGFSDLQIWQEKLDEVVVRWVPGARYKAGEVERFCGLLAERLGTSTTVRAERVASIERSRQQKKRLVVSSLGRS